MPGRYIFRTTIDYNHFRQQDGKGISLIDGKVISVLNFARTLSPLCQFPCREPGFIRTITIRVFTPRAWIVIYFLYPFLLWQRVPLLPLICDMIWSKNFMFLAKFGQTVYQDRETIGSGNDEIPGNRKADLQMQLRIKF